MKFTRDQLQELIDGYQLSVDVTYHNSGNDRFGISVSNVSADACWMFGTALGNHFDDVLATAIENALWSHSHFMAMEDAA